MPLVLLMLLQIMHFAFNMAGLGRLLGDVPGLLG